MIVGERFAWGHIPKTGGDAVDTLFHAVAPDLVLHADPLWSRGPRSKHEGFTTRGRAVTTKPILALNMRRLPARALSSAHHAFRNGRPPHYRPLPMETAESISHARDSDRILDHFTDGGRLRIHWWLRMEELRQDFIQFVSQFRPLSAAELGLARTVTTKKQAYPYSHDPARFFSQEQVERLYANNPCWADVERQVYGDTLLDRGIEWQGLGEDALHGR